MSNLAGKHLLLIVGGGIAAYKMLETIRRARERGARVSVVMTEAAKQFVTPLSLASLSGGKVYDDLFSLTDEVEMGHIQLSRSADLIVVAPATADLMAKAAHGLAHDLASTLLLATDKPVIFVPAMNVRMWLHPATQRNVAMLRAAGDAILGPDDGQMACGEFGPGRLIEPPDLLDRLERLIAQNFAQTKKLPAAAAKILAGQRAIVTAGPTREPIDPVRYISNKSSGKQGFAIAAALAAAGAETILVSGPVELPAPPGVVLHKVETALEMRAAVLSALPADIFVAAAAVADWRVLQAGVQKAKKGAGVAPSLELVENPDILREVAHLADHRPRLVVGFAAETENLIAHAQAKLGRKGCDLIVANDVGAEQSIFGGDLNRVTLIEADRATPWPQATKDEIAAKLVRLFAQQLTEK